MQHPAFVSGRLSVSDDPNVAYSGGEKVRAHGIRAAAAAAALCANTCARVQEMAAYLRSHPDIAKKAMSVRAHARERVCGWRARTQLTRRRARSQGAVFVASQSAGGGGAAGSNTAV
jgi:hypothetical protein